MTRLIRMVIAAAAAAALLCPAVAHAQPPGHSLDTAAPLAAGDTVDGTFDAAAGADWYGQLAANLEVMVQTGRYLEVRDLLRPDLSAADSQLLGSRLNQRQERVKLEADARG